MAGELSATIDTVKFVGGPIWSYLKNQYHFNANLNDFNSHKQDLLQLHGRIRSRLNTELHTGRKIAQVDVETWLAAAAVEIFRQSVEDEVSQSGCLSSRICRTRVLKRRIAELNRIYDEGERLSLMPSFVDDDYPSIVLDDIRIYKERKEKLLYKFQDVEWRLRTQLQDQAGKTEKKEVQLWRRNVEEKTGPAAAPFENQFNNVSHGGDFSRLVKEKIQQLEELLNDGALIPESLVVDDYSKTLRDDEMQSLKDWKEKLQGKRQDVELKLSTKLHQYPEKIVTGYVKQWLQKVDGIIDSAASKVQNHLSSGHPPYPASFVACVKELIREMEKLCNEGDQLPESLVVSDYSQTLGDAEIQSFEECYEKLLGKFQDVQQILRSQLRFGKIEKEQIKIWLKHVEETIASAADVQNQLSNGPPYMVSLVSLVKKVYQKMEKLYGEGGQLPESLVIDDPSTSAHKLATSELEGRDAVKAKISAYLIGDEVTKLGVHGMGGVGKTTIMEHVHNQLLKESQFKKVIWITVSQTFDVRQIQQQIASSLNESLPEHQNTVVRAATLSSMLGRHKPYVLILDDVWTSLELKDVGIPEPCVNDCCKLVLTTRSFEVVREMRYEPIEVKILSREASLKLFKDVVGDVALLEHEGIKETLSSIVNECDGLPLAINVVASSMRGISEPYRWRAALNQLRQGRRDDVFRTLKFSYDWLNDQKIQWCFLHCAMYPEDYEIPKEELIEYWMDEDLLVVMETRQATLDEGYAILNKLEENCLLEHTRSERYDEHDCVRMHDLVRDMAISITKSSSPHFLVKAGIGLRELPEEDEWKEGLLKVSLTWNRIEDIPSSMPSPRCPMLTTLLLSHNSFSSIPELFFEHMPELKVLDLSENWYLGSLPSSISKLGKLTTLLLPGCRYVKKVPFLSNLTNLKKLNLNGTAIREVPRGLEKLVKLRFLGLYVRHMSSEAKWAMLLSEILPNLSKLQYLRIHARISFKGEVLGSLSKLEVFSGSFHSASDMSIFLRSRRVSLQWYNISVGRYHDDFHFAKMKHICCSTVDVCGEMDFLPSDVQSLVIDRCNDVRSLNDVAGFQDITDLRVCWIGDCEGIEYVFSRSNRLTEVLKQLDLYHLDNLKGLFEVELTVGTFSSLERISIRGCRKITKLFPSSVLLHLQNLKDIVVTDCEQLEEIFAVSSSPLEEEDAGESLRLTHLPKLETLCLVDLPKLKCICGSTSRLIGDSFKSLIFELPLQLKRVPLQLPQSDDGQLSPPPHLSDIQVHTREWWESSEWDQPNAKDVLLPFCRFLG